MAAGSSHALALRSDGTVWAWGYGFYGQLGVGPLPSPYWTNSPIRSLMPTQAVVVAIAAGDSHSVALDANGNVWTWGAGDSGQLGTGGYQSTNLPTLLTSISNVIAIAAGDLHTIALTADKKLWTWGNNGSGQLGDGTRTWRPTPVAVSGLSNVVAIAGGYQFSLAVASNGQVYAWGDNSFGQLGRSGVSLTNRPMVVAGISNAVLVTANPSVGDDLYTAHSLAVTISNGVYQIWGWGDNSQGQVGNGTSGANNYQYTPALLHFCPECEGGCVQLGTSGTFTAPCTGTLKLYFNDDAYDDNGTNSYTVTVDGFSPVTVFGSSNEGVVVGTVSNGVTYSYTATGFCSWNAQTCGSGCEVDASGVDHDRNLRDCDAAHGSTDYDSEPRGGFICPTAICYSLVGRIQ